MVEIPGSRQVTPQNSIYTNVQERCVTRVDEKATLEKQQKQGESAAGMSRVADDGPGVTPSVGETRARDGDGD
jgi:hypothetical protein